MKHRFKTVTTEAEEKTTNRLDEYIEQYQIQLDPQTRHFYDDFVCTSSTHVRVSEAANAIIADNSRPGRMYILFVGFDGKCSIAVGRNM